MIKEAETPGQVFVTAEATALALPRERWDFVVLAGDFIFFVFGVLWCMWRMGGFDCLPVRTQLSLASGAWVCTYRYIWVYRCMDGWI